MSKLNLFLVLALVLQIAMVVAGHFSPAVLGLSGILGVGIPFVVGALYGAGGATSPKAAAGGGFLIGIVGAFIGILLAILMGDQTWILLTFGPPSSGVTGLLGALLLYALAGRLRALAASPA